MSEVEFQESCVRQINADVRASYDKDYGVPTNHHLDPRNDFPDTCWMDEEDAETRLALLAEMDKAEVISDAMFLRSEAEIWRRRCGIAELKLEETRKQLAAALKVKA